VKKNSIIAISGVGLCLIATLLFIYRQPVELSLKDNDSIAGIGEKILIEGEVENPGYYPFEKNISIKQLLSLSGGFSNRADQDYILVSREKNGVTEKYSAILTDTVMPKDIITVLPYKPHIIVDGEVAKPGRYKFKPNMTVLEAITMAGGCTTRSSCKYFLVNRKRNGKNESNRALHTDIMHSKDRVVVH